MSQKSILITIAIVALLVISDIVVFYLLPPKVRIKSNIVQIMSPFMGIMSKSFPVPKNGEAVAVGKYAIENRNGNILLTQNNEIIRTIN